VSLLREFLERIIVRAQSNQESFTFFDVHQYGLIKRVEDNVRRSRDLGCSSLITVWGISSRES
jgi:hypothetical protein